jgi:hypothetical protein
MLSNEIIHVGDRNSEQATAFVSSRLAFLRLTNITHVEVIPGPNVSRDELMKIISTDERFWHSVERVENHIATIYVVLK